MRRMREKSMLRLWAEDAGAFVLLVLLMGGLWLFIIGLAGMMGRG